MAFTDLKLERFRDLRMPVLVILIAVSLFLEIFVHWYLGISVVYSHFFYIPVVLAAVWYGKRSVIVALILGIAQLAGTCYSVGALDMGSLARALMFVVIALVIGAISDHMKKEQEQLINEVTDAALRSGLRSGGTSGSAAERKSRILSFASVKKLRERSDVPGLIRALSNRDPAVQYEAVEALGNIGDPASTEALMDALTGDQYSGIRWKAAEALGKIGAPAVPPLIRALKNPDEDVRWKAAVTLGEIGDARAVGPLVDLLGDEDRFVRSRAAYALGLIGPDAVAGLRDALVNGSVETRRGAVAALGMIPDPDAVKALIQDLDDPSDEVRQDVIDALSRQGKRAFDPLVQALRAPGQRIAEGAALALAGSGRPEAVGALILALDTADPAMRPVLQSAVNDLVARQNRQVSKNAMEETPDFNHGENQGLRE
ncbi:MAG: HEAT repeat domain-containing protein [Methanoregulaceae archaeon]|jgi:HEAT repeat protein|nr:HEAT repeat domain-containing protein [Methanoregulaceae archaeon]MCU0628989.1 HEAT repeat domain-containing protein [Methanoregulaceae archaeon]